MYIITYETKDHLPRKVTPFYFCIFIFLEQLEARLKATNDEIERYLKYLPAFKILPKDDDAYLKIERKLKGLNKRKWLLERLIIENNWLLIEMGLGTEKEAPITFFVRNQLIRRNVRLWAYTY